MNDHISLFSDKQACVFRNRIYQNFLKTQILTAELMQEGTLYEKITKAGSVIK